MNDLLWHVHFAGGQKVAWALDEDLRWAREALAGKIRETGLPAARIVHAAWWPALAAIGDAALQEKTVVCFADNPPALYLTQPGFEWAARRVDLWIARSREAAGQFASLGLRVAQVPYCIDPNVFRPLPDSASIRRECGLSNDAFVIGNFHRDSEGGNLAKPKAQKGPDIFFEIARELHSRLPRTVVLLAGPRRHWLRRELERAGVPYRFVGEARESDDYKINILDRKQLNRLYQALDVCVISSRWEGGPYSVIESLFAGRPALSTPVGMSRDALPADDLYRSVAEAVVLLQAQAESRLPLDESIRKKALHDYSLDHMRDRLLAAYATLPKGGVSRSSAWRSGASAIINQFQSRMGRSLPGKAQVSKSEPPAGILPVETPLAPGLDREALMRSASDIAWFRG